jgi:hypothetical protein
MGLARFAPGSTPAISLCELNACSNFRLMDILPAMHRTWTTTILALILAISGVSHAKDAAARIRKAVEKSTLNQPGTKPFHMKAVVAPTKASERASNRTGTVEIWWAAPDRWRRELHSPEFQQIEIVNGAREWQKNEGDYFPEWLREVAVALIDPVPSLDTVLAQVDSGEEKKLMGMSHFSWMMMSSNGSVEKAMGGALAIDDKTGLLLYGGGFGWGGEFKEPKNFHGRMVAQTVRSGSSPEVTAQVTVLDDLKDPAPDLFDAAKAENDVQLLKTLTVDEPTLRKNLLPAGAPAWPPLPDGPREGVLTTAVTVDRAGKVREIDTIVSDNPAIADAAREFIRSMHFQPYVDNGVPVQVVSRITLPFKVDRPAGVEVLESARFYFDGGRKLSFPAAGTGPPYVLEASFQARTKGGTLETGKYVDSWKSETEWRREATIGSSRCIRSRHGDDRYQLVEGPDEWLVRLALRVMEPIPAMDTFVESDWKMKRDTITGEKTIRVLTGYESPEGKLDPDHARGYWFDESGKLVRTYFLGMEMNRSKFEDYNGIAIPREIEVLSKGDLGMLIEVQKIVPAGELPDSEFIVSGHKWNRAFTDEVR